MMAQWLRALAALPEDPDSIPSMTVRLRSLIPFQEESYALFWPPRALHAHGAQT